MVSLSGSLAKTIALLEEDKPAEAAQEYKRRFVPTMKKLYSEAAEVYPVRFSKAKEWCAWTKRLYIWTRKAEDTLTRTEKGETDGAVPFLLVFREYFFVLHEETGQLACGDHIYLFYKELLQKSPKMAVLKKAVAGLEKAKPSMKAKGGAEAYAKAKAAWLDQVSPVLDAGALGSAEVAQLVEMTKPFFMAYGLPFE
ncbi:MAG: hypothetical protein GY851_19990 [bacterium]|nr:hypothetical protein [bacterium]